MTLAEEIREYGNGRAYTGPGTPPCRDCGAIPEMFWIVQGSNPQTGASCSFGHQRSSDAARVQLAALQKRHPEYTVWEIGRYTPTVTTVLEYTTEGSK